MAGNPVNVRHMRAVGVLCRQQGLRVVEVNGWEGRGRSSDLIPEHSVCHHTGATRDSTRVLVDGRADLAGPLCNFELRLDGTVALLASGRANHAGVGTVPSSRSYGTEATGPVPAGNTGAGAFPQYKAYVILQWAIRKHHGWPIGRIVAHKETARPLGRKIDPSFDMGAFRRAILAHDPTPAAPVPPPIVEADMPLNDADKRFIIAVRDDGVQATDHGDARIGGTDNNLAVISRRLDDLEGKLDQILSALPQPPA